MVDKQPLLQIGKVAQRTEMSIATLRHYDEVGLVGPSARSEGGFRLYTEEDVQRILVIRRMKPLEFSLEEMATLLDSVDALNNPSSSAADKKRAGAFVRECHTKAEEAVRKLRKRVAYAEELTEILASQTPVLPAVEEKTVT